MNKNQAKQFLASAYIESMMDVLAGDAPELTDHTTTLETEAGHVYEVSIRHKSGPKLPLPSARPAGGCGSCKGCGPEGACGT